MSARNNEPPAKTNPAIVAIIERDSELDRVWFLRHPDRDHRVRRLIQGEPLVEIASPLPAYVVVKQVVPGFRMRIAFWGTRPPCGCETCAANLWNMFSPPEAQPLVIEGAAIALRGSAP